MFLSPKIPNPVNKIEEEKESSVVDGKPKIPKMHIYIAIAVIIVILIVGATAYYFYNKKKKKVVKKIPPPPPPTSEQLVQNENILNDLKSNFTNQEIQDSIDDTTEEIQLPKKDPEGEPKIVEIEEKKEEKKPEPPAEDDEDSNYLD